ncbi:MAG: hypothetical protein BWY25_03037 [Chloroflexi bacterium ADurb.Bin222]|nr:MAG: hypothetical protein BWY25_03037 [Chloroflexi bacterium ADurb.Bin222]
MIAAQPRALPLRDRHAAFHEAGVLQDAQILGYMTLSQPGKSRNLALRARIVGNGAQDAYIVVRLVDKVLQQQARLNLHQVVGGQQFVANIIREGRGRVEPFPIGRNAAPDGVDRHPFVGIEAGKIVCGHAKGQGLQP